MVSRKNRTKTTNDPLQREKDIEQLAKLLIKAAPLAEVLNSPDTTHEDRAKLREVVGSMKYFKLTTTLCQMCSWRVWEISHAKDEAARKRLSRPGYSGVTLDENGVTFHEFEDEPSSDD